MKFHTVEQALKWAYEMRTRPVVAASPLSGVRSVGLAQEDDRSMEATDILKRTAMSVSYYEKAFLNFMFGQDDLALPVLTQLFEELGIPARSRALELILKSYRGDKKAGGLRELRKSLSVGMLKTVSIRGRVYDYLDAIHDRAIKKLRQPLEGYLNERVR